MNLQLIVILQKVIKSELYLLQVIFIESEFKKTWIISNKK